MICSLQVKNDHNDSKLLCFRVPVARVWLWFVLCKSQTGTLRKQQEFEFGHFVPGRRGWSSSADEKVSVRSRIWHERQTELKTDLAAASSNWNTYSENKFETSSNLLSLMWKDGRTSSILIVLHLLVRFEWPPVQNDIESQIQTDNTKCGSISEGAWVYLPNLKATWNKWI